ncbi:unnamed protein product [Paramecium primaurelia]|uniref:Uncharacterized protein n=1 Tax=Paramecium primaurelia TaxID=5886 RepID=A0A8S1PCU4_PARPR|nr:unnamed protein product [Paramecium primaurelia]
MVECSINRQHQSSLVFFQFSKIIHSERRQIIKEKINLGLIQKRRKTFILTFLAKKVKNLQKKLKDIQQILKNYKELKN